MTFPRLLELAAAAWTWLALPALAAVAVWCAVALRGAPYARLGAGLASLRAPRDGGDGVAPGPVLAASVAGSWGAAGIAAAGTALALGGAGAVAWSWVLALLLVPLRYAETLLARTPAPGRRGAAGSLAARLRGDDAVAARSVGVAVVVASLLGVPLLAAGLHGGALVDAARQTLPEATAWIVLGATAIAAALVASPRGLVVAGWIGLAGLVAAAVPLLAAAGANPARAIAVLGRGLGEMMSGAPSVDAFTGATAGQVAAAGLLSLAPPLAGATGTVGGLHARANAAAARRQAALAGWGPLFAALMTTLVGAAVLATGAFYRPVPDARSLSELTAWSEAFETASQRAETERRHEGFLRIIEGEARDLDVDLATERGLVEEPHFTVAGAPADVAVQVVGGRPTLPLTPSGALGVLEKAPVSMLDEVTVEGRMLPRGAGLVLAAVARGTEGGGMPRLLVVALAWLVAVAAAALGHGLAATLRDVGPPLVARLAPALPVLALPTALAAPRWLGAASVAAAAVLAVVAAVAIALRVRQASRA